MILHELRGFIADLDGTIIPDGLMAVEDPKLMGAFTELDSQIAAHIATGRTYDFCRTVFDGLSVSQLAITENGSSIVEPVSSEIIYELQLSDSVTENVLSLCSEVAGMEQCRFAGDPRETNSTVNERLASANKGIFILNLDRSKAEKITNTLSQVAVHSYVSKAWGEDPEKYDVNIHHPQANKGVALQKLANLLRHDIKSLIVVGNDINDLPMFKLARVTAAPADAHPDILRRADIIIPPASENGFLKIIDMFRTRKFIS